MFRRHFILQVLLGWILALGKRNSMANNLESLPPVNSEKINSLLNLEPITFFVATNGRDDRAIERAIGNPDRPFASWQGVQKAIRKIEPKKINRPIEVIFRGGTYQLTEPIAFTTADSGTELFPISYQAAPQEQVIVSGGRTITNWQEKNLNGLRLWAVNLPESFKRARFQHLWVNGVRRRRARYPNQGYLQVQSVHHRKGQNWHDGHRSFRYHPADIPSHLRPKGGEVVVMNRWVESRLPIIKVDPQRNSLHFAKESVFKLAPGDPYYLEGAFELLDTPGEWHLDRGESRLYYLPLPEETLANTQVIIPVLDTLVQFEGQAKDNKFISHLKFENLIFAHTDWHLPKDKSGYTHNAWGVPGAIIANGINHCSWRYCTFEHLGNHAIELWRGCHHNQITGCTFSDLGAGAIKIGERQTSVPNIVPEEISHHNSITHNHIYDGGKFFPSAVGIRAVHSHNNAIAYNHIHDLYYTAIAVRGTWGFEETQAYANIIERNYIHHIGKLSNGEGAILSDMGAIYNLGHQKGTVIRHNTIHDVAGIRYGGWGIYLDEGSSFIKVENNLVYNTTDGAFCQHYGMENLIVNNIFAFGKKTQILRNKRDLKTALRRNTISFYFKHNIIYWQQGKFIAGLSKNEKYQAMAVFDRNIYWQTNQPNPTFGNLSWREWQEHDRYSRFVDPLFIDPQEGNFQLQANSPVNNWQVKLNSQMEDLK